MLNSSLISQHTDNPIPYFIFSKGFGVIAPDSAFSIHLHFRMQNRFGMSSLSDYDLSTQEAETELRCFCV